MTIWRYSSRDALLVAASLIELGMKLWLVIGFASWGAGELAAFFAALTLLNFFNYECTGHFFIHTPFFRRRGFNGAFGLLNSIAIGFPQTLYRAEHLNHHRFGSDHRDASTGTTGDHSSIYRHGKTGTTPEPMLRYAVLMPLRQDVLRLVRMTPVPLRGQLALEALGVLWLLVCAAYVSLWAMVFLCVLSWAGSALTHAENWLQHAHAIPGSRQTDAVSCYGRWYNLLWFNNGYHQEHHFRPGVHWSEAPDLRSALPPETCRRVVAWSIWHNL